MGIPSWLLYFVSYHMSMKLFFYFILCFRIYFIYKKSKYSVINPHLTACVRTWGLFRTPLVFLNICQTNVAIDIKCSVPLKTSLLHPMCKYKFLIYDGLAGNDVRVTPCSGDFDAKEGSTRSALLDLVFF